MPEALMGSGLTWDDLLRTWSGLEVPEGWRPEITLGGILITPPPSGAHHLIADVVNRALVTNVLDELGIFQTLGVGVRSVGGIFIPDFCVVPRRCVPSTGSDPVNGEHVLLAVEITSPGNAEHDRKRKKWSYARAGIEQYLLVDAFDPDGPASTLFSRPEDGIYRTSERTPFGQKVTLAAPVATVIDTGLFPLS